MEPASIIVAAVIGVIGGIFTPGIRRLALRRRRSSTLIGSWECKWDLDAASQGALATVQDIVAIKAVDDERVTGTGSNATFGAYELEGRETPYAVTLSYRGQDDNSNLAGVVLLRKGDVRGKVLHGHWWQYRDDHTLGGGATRWTKK